ncbi:MAG: hypothetical protein JXM69_01770 [Anaerolineae bacterium]|nr:hypothetical protein [Anaerolineae bacterium]
MHQKWWILGSVILAILSFFCLRYVVQTFWPDPEVNFARSQLLLFALMFLGVGASSVPVTVFLNNRFSKPDWLERDRIRLIRQGVWVGLATVLLAYLQLIRTLSWVVAIVVVGVFALIETFFLTRE